MIYTVTNEFTKIAVTNGAIQNTSSCLVVEISETPTAGKGILLYPFQTFQIGGTTVYARTIGKESVDLRVVPFYVSTGGGGNSSSADSGVTVDESLVAGDDEIDGMLDDIFG